MSEKLTTLQGATIRWNEVIDFTKVETYTTGFVSGNFIMTYKDETYDIKEITLLNGTIQYTATNNAIYYPYVNNQKGLYFDSTLYFERVDYIPGLEDILETEFLDFVNTNATQIIDEPSQPTGPHILYKGNVIAALEEGKETVLKCKDWRMRGDIIVIYQEEATNV